MAPYEIRRHSQYCDHRGAKLYLGNLVRLKCPLYVYTKRLFVILQDFLDSSCFTSSCFGHISTIQVYGTDGLKTEVKTNL